MSKTLRDMILEDIKKTINRDTVNDCSRFRSVFYVKPELPETGKYGKSQRKFIDNCINSTRVDFDRLDFLTDRELFELYGRFLRQRNVWM